MRFILQYVVTKNKHHIKFLVLGYIKPHFDVRYGHKKGAPKLLATACAPFELRFLCAEGSIWR